MRVDIARALSLIASAHRMELIENITDETVEAFTRELFVRVPESQFTLDDLTIITNLRDHMQARERARMQRQEAGSSSNPLLEKNPTAD